MNDKGPWQGWKAMAGGAGLIVAGCVMLWWSLRPGVSPTVAAFLQAQAMTAIPAGLGIIGLRDKQNRMAKDLKNERPQVRVSNR
jgi:hypothetical protein